MEERIRNIFETAMESTVNHEKLRRKLECIYNEMDFESFFNCFAQCMKCLWQSDIVKINKFVRTGLTFAANFISHLALNYTPVNNEAHLLFGNVVERLITACSCYSFNIRYNSIWFFSILIEMLGSNFEMDVHLIDKIQENILVRVEDHKSEIRALAINALCRLQDPTDLHCPIIAAISSCLEDESPKVRIEAIMNVALTNFTLLKLMDKAMDVNKHVRTALYKKFYKFRPTVFPLWKRHNVIVRGLNCDNGSNPFFLKLLAKWFEFYDLDFTRLFNALKIDATLKDLEATAEICTKTFNHLIKEQSIDQVFDQLPLEKELRLIPLEKLDVEISLFWKLLFLHLSKVEELFSYQEKAVSDVAPFCQYIKKMSEKFTTNLDDFELLELNFILKNLLEILEGLNHEEEVGRKSIINLLKDLLKLHKISVQNKEKIIQFLSTFLGDNNALINQIMAIVEEINKKVCNNKKTAGQLQVEKYEIAVMRVKVHSIEVELEEAMKQMDLEVIERLQKQKSEIKEQLAEIENRKSLGDSNEVTADENLIHILELALALLRLPKINKITEELEEFANKFINIESPNGLVQRRTRECVVIMGLFSKKIATEYIDFMCSPIIQFRSTSQYDVHTLGISLYGMGDWLRLYGLSIFDLYSEIDTAGVNFVKSRRLYEDDKSINESTSHKCTFDEFLSVYCDALDLPDDDLKEFAARSINGFFYDGELVTKDFFKTVIIKWFNEKGSKFAQLMMHGIMQFAQSKTGFETFAKTFVSIAKLLVVEGTELENEPKELLNFFVHTIPPEYDVSIKNVFAQMYQDVFKLVKNSAQNRYLTVVWISLLVNLPHPRNDSEFLKKYSTDLTELIATVKIKKAAQILLKELEKVEKLQKENEKVEKIEENLEKISVATAATTATVSNLSVDTLVADAANKKSSDIDSTAKINYHRVTLKPVKVMLNRATVEKHLKSRRSKRKRSTGKLSAKSSLENITERAKKKSKAEIAGQSSSTSNGKSETNSKRKRKNQLQNASSCNDSSVIGETSTPIVNETVRKSTRARKRRFECCSKCFNTSGRSGLLNKSCADCLRLTKGGNKKK